ncbi:hypothetical protein [Nostoc sp. LEGE 12450]|uniref:hypothetical protein n=1 Tax=Nostoc sp. LEGE 12450 TaxID=1828643 RepID=UPI00187FD2F1|nr:hypothetical protein [Nostoc sp. LEGE 12450]MBE8988048.1 hypothetical protein [Nostoc sp. LEGE 12450]
MLKKVNLISIIIAISVFSNFTLYGCQRILKSEIAKEGEKEIIRKTVKVKIKKSSQEEVRDIVELGRTVRSLGLSSSPIKKIANSKSAKKYKIKFSLQSQPVFLEQEEFIEFIAREKKFKDLTGKSYIRYKQELTDKIITETEVIPDDTKTVYEYLTEKIYRDLPQKLKFKNDKILDEKLYGKFEKYYFSKLSTNIYQELNDTLSIKIGNKVPKNLMDASLKLAADKVTDEFLIASFISYSLDARTRKLINGNDSENDSLSIEDIFFLKNEKKAVNKSFSSFINKELTEDLNKYLNKELIKKGDLWSSRGYKVRQGILIGASTAVSIKVINYLIDDYKKDDLNRKR